MTIFSIIFGSVFMPSLFNYDNNFFVNNMIKCNKYSVNYETYDDNLLYYFPGNKLNPAKYCLHIFQNNYSIVNLSSGIFNNLALQVSHFNHYYNKFFLKIKTLVFLANFPGLKFIFEVRGQLNDSICYKDYCSNYSIDYDQPSINLSNNKNHNKFKIENIDNINNDLFGIDINNIDTDHRIAKFSLLDHRKEKLNIINDMHGSFAEIDTNNLIISKDQYTKNTISTDYVTKYPSKINQFFNFSFINHIYLYNTTIISLGITFVSTNVMPFNVFYSFSININI